MTPEPVDPRLDQTAAFLRDFRLSELEPIVQDVVVAFMFDEMNSVRRFMNGSQPLASMRGWVEQWTVILDGHRLLEQYLDGEDLYTCGQYPRLPRKTKENPCSDSSSRERSP